MAIFLQIFFSNAVLLFVLIAIHEVGHWVMGYVTGIPAGQMRIRLLTFPQQVQLKDEGKWISVSGFDRYFTVLRQFVPSTGGQFLYVVSGFLFETVFLIGLCIALLAYDYRLFAIVAPGLSLSMYVVYVFAMDLPQSKRLQRPWGDTTILYSLSPRGAIAVSVLMVGVRLALVGMAWLQSG